MLIQTIYITSVGILSIYTSGFTRASDKIDSGTPHFLFINMPLWSPGEKTVKDMALMYCRECGKQISSNAPTCPYCGSPQQLGNTGKSNEINLGYLFVSFLFPIIRIVLILASSQGENRGRLKSAVIGTCTGLFIQAFLYVLFYE